MMLQKILVVWCWNHRNHVEDQSDVAELDLISWGEARPMAQQLNLRLASRWSRSLIRSFRAEFLRLKDVVLRSRSYA